MNLPTKEELALVIYRAMYSGDPPATGSTLGMEMAKAAARAVLDRLTEAAARNGEEVA